MTAVLIVDDEKDLRDGLAEAVRDLGYEALAAVRSAGHYGDE
jgi:CheY-like chemotaxis protein